MAPELAGEAAPELDGLRDGCGLAIRRLAAARADVLVVVGGGAATAAYPGEAAGTLAPWGADVRVGAGKPVLPLSATVGGWLLDRAGTRPSAYQIVAGDAAPRECLALGAELAGRAPRVALLVMGDGSARLTVKSPGYLHPGAEEYDAALARALAAADTAALAALDPAEAGELWVGGRAAFQVLAGAAGDTGAFHGEPLYDEAPYGVGYRVVSWSRGDA
ncbi:class III extradiol ring-cleavage dioxygenase family protein [Sphaerisporangium aureirubrum]|uniref:Uncharacterized protein n=1 Tax=Sphaerisporangium aureirubrum TaxID=1544736 RepID=A0ABW1NQY2_9ACTN